MASHTCRGKLPRLLFRATAATVMSLRILRFHRFQALHGNSISILRLSLSRTRLSQLSKLKTSRVARQWLRCPRTIITQSFKSGARNEWFCSKPIIPIKLKKSISNWLFFYFSDDLFINLTFVPDCREPILFAHYHQRQFHVLLLHRRIFSARSD